METERRERKEDREREKDEREREINQDSPAKSWSS